MEIMIAAQKTEKFDIEFAIQVALLHDILEDTETTFDEIANEFGKEIAQAVLALTKNSNIAKEVWAVKLADRITNLQAPPEHWSIEKITEYHKQTVQIYNSLKGGNEYLENRLLEKISDYLKYQVSLNH